MLSCFLLDTHTWLRKTDKEVEREKERERERERERMKPHASGLMKPVALCTTGILRFFSLSFALSVSPEARIVVGEEWLSWPSCKLQG